MGTTDYPQTVRAFNETHNPRVVMLDKGFIELPPQVWVNVPGSLAFTYLNRIPGVIIDLTDTPYTGGPNELPLPNLLVCGRIDRVFGWSVFTERLIHHLAAEGPYQLSFQSLGQVTNHEGVSPLVTDLFEQMVRHGIPNHEWALVFGMPYELPGVPARKRVLFTMWEAESFPQPDERHKIWPDYVNEYAEALIVPSIAQQKFWQRHVAVPVHLCPLGVDTSVWTFQERPQRPVGTPFTVLLYGILAYRKSPIETLTQVCYRAFRNVDDWHLILKTRMHALGAGQFGTDFIRDDHVEIINAGYTLSEMVALCRRADLGVMLSKYEGAGLPPLEMAATGLDVMLTNYSGLADICDERYNIPVGITRIMTNTQEGDAYRDLENWAMPDFAEAAEKMRAEYDAWHKRGRTQSPRGTRAAAWVQREKTWVKVYRQLISLLKGIIQ